MQYSATDNALHPMDGKPAPADSDAAPLLVEDIGDDQGAAWDAFLGTQPRGSFYHLHGWRGINQTQFGHRCHYLAARRQGRIEGVLPLVLLSSRLFGRILCTLPFVNFGGIVAANGQAESSLLREAAATADRLDADYLEIRAANPLDTDMAASLHKVSMTIHLDPDPDTLWKAFASKHRTNVRRVYKHDVQVHAGGMDLLDEFYDVLAESWRNLGTPIYRKAYFREILSRFPDKTRIFVCRQGDKPISVAFNGEYNGVVEGMWLGSRPEARQLQASYALYWEMIKDACERGFSRFHLGRSTVDSGGEGFKKKWNAEATQLYWYHYMPKGGPAPQLNVDNPKFRLAIAAWRRMPLKATTLIGPLISRSIP
ncbi:FemAB-related protein, PEP-CTERM system-associated [Thioalkalivibrio sulfidiphilus HL-EbGr7]|uniref:FemAB-related protein, PEP-CTERM system-associated n=1 Tax=Thioalkalivibrio sulfidiphilus (strain HL-EbGR7) TaxID=396588 RepID=B8GVA1_THISH|nr:FemAB family XrtA/PEP-CTERM system-associated protein [Thioalkalivibrio sulfidiphilus]ACL73447.1 FemAB-related protein, PEP-CTERM system-associated [Thioalkalivibrio sulfidiphilus HL-EbGr7]